MLNKAKQLNDFIIKLDKIPLVSSDTIIKDVIDKMGISKLGIACLIDDKGELLGVVTDGDIRRNLVNIQKPFSAFFSDNIEIISNKKPVTLRKGDTIEVAVKKMIDSSVWDIPILDNNKLIGLVHFHDLVKCIL